MKVIYIAGPYRASHAWALEQNVRRAEAWALEVARAGGIPLCPHTLNRFFFGVPGLSEEDFWIPGMLELLRRSDGVLLIPGWEASQGALGEKRQAEAWGIPVLEMPTKILPHSSVSYLKLWIDAIDTRAAVSA